MIEPVADALWDVSVSVALALTLETKELKADVTSEESEDVVGVADPAADVMTEFAELTSDAMDEATDAAEDKAEEIDATSEAVEATDSRELAKDKIDVAASLADDSTELAKSVTDAKEAVSVLVGEDVTPSEAEVVGAEETLKGSLLVGAVLSLLVEVTLSVLVGVVVSVLVAVALSVLVGLVVSVLVGSVVSLLDEVALSLLKTELNASVIPSSSVELALEVWAEVMVAEGSELVADAIVVLWAGADTGPVAGVVDGVTVATVLAGVFAELLETVFDVEEPPSMDATPDNSFPTDERRLPTPESVELELVVSVDVVFVTCLFTALGK